jgi:hypothetical protein
VQDKRQKVLQTFNGKDFTKSKSEILALFPEYKLKVFDEYGIYLKNLGTITDKKEEKYVTIRLGQFQKITTIRFSSIIN